MIVHEVEPYNAESPRSALLAPLTAADAFYSRNHGPIPQLDPVAWRLRVGGLVDRPMELSLAELRERFTEHEVVATLQCAGNRRAGLIAVRDIPGEAPWGPGATSTGRWAGARLADVLAAAGLVSEVSDVAFGAPDVSPLPDPPETFGASVPVGKASAPEVLLAWSMNGESLPVLHGGPVRVVVPGYIGARSVKWVERVTAQDHPSDNYFQATAYRLLPADAQRGRPGDGLSLGPVALNTEILSPDGQSEVAAGATTVTGYALAGDGRGVARVDVSADGGQSWQQASLQPAAGPWAWRHWTAQVDLPPGEAELVARAWDTTAALQPEHAASVWNPKGYVNNSWARLPLTVR